MEVVRVTCGKCQRYGHDSSTCTFIRSAYHCSICNDIEHNKRRCPHRKETEESTFNSSSFDEDYGLAGIDVVKKEIDENQSEDEQGSQREDEKESQVENQSENENENQSQSENELENESENQECSNVEGSECEDNDNDDDNVEDDYQEDDCDNMFEEDDGANYVEDAGFEDDENCDENIDEQDFEYDDGQDDNEEAFDMQDDYDDPEEDNFEDNEVEELNEDDFEDDDGDDGVDDADGDEDMMGDDYNPQFQAFIQRRNCLKEQARRAMFALRQSSKQLDENKFWAIENTLKNMECDAFNQLRLPQLGQSIRKCRISSGKTLGRRILKAHFRKARNHYKEGNLFAVREVMKYLDAVGKRYIVDIRMYMVKTNNLVRNLEKRINSTLRVIKSANGYMLNGNQKGMLKCRQALLKYSNFFRCNCQTKDNIHACLSNIASTITYVQNVTSTVRNLINGSNSKNRQIIAQAVQNMNKLANEKRASNFKLKGKNIYQWIAYGNEQIAKLDYLALVSSKISKSDMLLKQQDKSSQAIYDLLEEMKALRKNKYSKLTQIQGAIKRTSDTILDLHTQWKQSMKAKALDFKTKNLPKPMQNARSIFKSHVWIPGDEKKSTIILELQRVIRGAESILESKFVSQLKPFHSSSLEKLTEKCRFMHSGLVWMKDSQTIVDSLLGKLSHSSKLNCVSVEFSNSFDSILLEFGSIVENNPKREHPVIDNVKEKLQNLLILFWKYSNLMKFELWATLSKQHVEFLRRNSEKAVANLLDVYHSQNHVDQFESSIASSMNDLISEFSVDYEGSENAISQVGNFLDYCCNLRDQMTHVIESYRNKRRSLQPNLIKKGSIFNPFNENSRCNGCSKKFGLLRFRLRHHCRKCGLLFCDECAPTKTFIPELDEIEKEVTVCNGCLNLPIHVEYQVPTFSFEIFSQNAQYLEKLITKLASDRNATKVENPFKIEMK
jgi:hypothetical protein